MPKCWVSQLSPTAAKPSYRDITNSAAICPLLCSQQYPNKSSFPVSVQHGQVHPCLSACRFKGTCLCLTPRGIYGSADYAMEHLSAYFIPSESNMPKCISPKLKEGRNTYLIGIHQNYRQEHMTQTTRENIHSIENCWLEYNMRLEGQQGLRNQIWGSPQGQDSLSLKVLVQCSELDTNHSVTWDVRIALKTNKPKNKQTSRMILCRSFNSTDGRSGTQHQGNHRWFLTGGTSGFLRPAAAGWLWVSAPWHVYKDFWFSDWDQPFKYCLECGIYWNPNLSFKSWIYVDYSSLSKILHEISHWH